MHQDLDELLWLHEKKVMAETNYTLCRTKFDNDKMHKAQDKYGDAYDAFLKKWVK